MSRPFTPSPPPFPFQIHIPPQIQTDRRQKKEDWQQKKELHLGRRFLQYKKTGSRRLSYIWVDVFPKLWVDACLPSPFQFILGWRSFRHPPTCYLPEVPPHPVVFVLHRYAESHVSKPLSLHTKTYKVFIFNLLVFRICACLIHGLYFHNIFDMFDVCIQCPMFVVFVQIIFPNPILFDPSSPFS